MKKYTIQKGVCWGFIPARGGSKSIPLKNIATFCGKPLMDYCINAAKHCNGLDKIICSTDSIDIERYCNLSNIEVHNRPKELSGDDVDIKDVIDDFLRSIDLMNGKIPEMIALIQPTSPFVLPEHIDSCIKALDDDQKAGSSQTIAPCPHNSHAYNQRVVDKEGYVRFRFEEYRKESYNKQKKPIHYLFGNVLVFRTLSMLEQQSVFPTPSSAVEIEISYAFDADGPEDFVLGCAIVKNNLVSIN
jgi:CMP-N,N'-diacetyllegionaminic acid synthase